MLIAASLLAMCLGRLNMNLVRCEEVITTLKASLDCSGRIDLPGARQLLNSGINEILDGNEDFAKGAEFCEKGNIEA